MNSGILDLALCKHLKRGVTQNRSREDTETVFRGMQEFMWLWIILSKWFTASAILLELRTLFQSSSSSAVVEACFVFQPRTLLDKFDFSLTLLMHLLHSRN